MALHSAQTATTGLHRPWFPASATDPTTLYTVPDGAIWPDSTTTPPTLKEYVSAAWVVRLGPQMVPDHDHTGDAGDGDMIAGSGSLTAEEVDGTPSGPIDTLVFPNGTLAIVGTTGTYTPAGGGSGLYDAYALIRDKKSSTAVGGTLTTGGWRTRDLNDEAADTASIVSVASNQFTITGSGNTFWIVARAPNHRTERTRIRLRDITNGVTLSVSPVLRADTGSTGGGSPHILSYFGVITGTVTFEIQMEVNNSVGTSDGGVDPTQTDSFGTIFTTVEIHRKAP